MSCYLHIFLHKRHLCKKYIHLGIHLGIFFSISPLFNINLTGVSCFLTHLKCQKYNKRYPKYAVSH